MVLFGPRQQYTQHHFRGGITSASSTARRPTEAPARRYAGAFKVDLLEPGLQALKSPDNAGEGEVVASLLRGLRNVVETAGYPGSAFPDQLIEAVMERAAPRGLKKHLIMREERDPRLIAGAVDKPRYVQPAEEHIVPLAPSSQRRYRQIATSDQSLQTDEDPRAQGLCSIRLRSDRSDGRGTQPGGRP